MATDPDLQLPPDLRPPRRSRAPWVVGGVVVAVAVVAAVAVGYFGVHTLVLDETVDEDMPTFASGAVVEDEPAATSSFEARDKSGEGTVTLLTDGTQTFVRFEDDFSTDNGPDLYAVAVVGGERVELGTLKGNRGAQNYELPAEVDPAEVEAVQVWCKRFDSTFVEAPLA